MSLSKPEKRVKDKTILTGRDDLIPREKWIPASEMETELQILNDKHGIFNDAFQKILTEHKMESEVAFFSLCTSTRPFHLSPKWRTFIELFKNVDFVVQSNAGIIPQKWFTSFPYLNYEGEPTIVGTPLYKEVLGNRLDSFLTHHPYPYILANFTPNQRNTTPTIEVLERLKGNGTIKDFSVIPNSKLYESARRDGWGKPNGKGAMFPTLHRFILDSLREQLDHWASDDGVSSRNGKNRTLRKRL